jgi:mRNA interferase MazF
MKAELPQCSRGEIWLLDWNPRRGSTQGEPRWGIVIQSDLGNHAVGARSTMVVPLTTQGRSYAFFVPIPKGKDNGLPADAWANATQVFTVDKSRLIHYLGKASPAQMKALAVALAAVLDF